MLTAPQFKKLLSDVRRMLSSAQSHKSVDNKLVESYWSIGKRIADSGVLEDAAYGGAVISNLSSQLGVDKRSLQRAIVFQSQYPALPAPGLTWAHYRELLTLSAPKERAFYERLARDEGLSRDRLQLAISSDVFSNKSTRQGGIRLRRPHEVRYVFQAALLRVVDGDTLLLDIDLGFEVTKQQRVRLAAVNTFSAQSNKGQAATLWVAERLSLADRIVIHTKRADLHGRYLAHVFYSTRKLPFLDTFAEGHYLNQQLLDEKLAMKMR